MSKSKADLYKSNEKKIQFKWQCVRLNKLYRAYVDAYSADDWVKIKLLNKELDESENDALNSFIGNLDFYPHHAERLLKKALAKGNPSLSKDSLNNIYRNWIENGFGRNPNHIRVHHTSLKTPVQSIPQCEITFSHQATKEQVCAEIDKAFKHFNKHFVKTKPHHKELFKYLDVYEKKTYKAMSLKTIADDILKRDQVSGDDAEYSETEVKNDVKRYYKKAKFLIEQGGFAGPF